MSCEGTEVLSIQYCHLNENYKIFDFCFLNKEAVYNPLAAAIIFTATIGMLVMVNKPENAIIYKFFRVYEAYIIAGVSILVFRFKTTLKYL